MKAILSSTLMWREMGYCCRIIYIQRSHISFKHFHFVCFKGQNVRKLNLAGMLQETHWKAILKIWFCSHGKVFSPSMLSWYFDHVFNLGQIFPTFWFSIIHHFFGNIFGICRNIYVNFFPHMFEDVRWKFDQSHKMFVQPTCSNIWKA